MRISKIVSLLAAIVSSVAGCGAQELFIVIVPLTIPDQKISVRFDGSKLTSQRSDNEPVVHRLTPAAANKIRKAITAIPQKQWGGHWGSIAFLDGCEIVAEVDRDGKKLKFSGSNGCPPGFSKIAKELHEASKLSTLRSGWKEMEESAKQYRSREHFFESILEEAKAAKAKKDDRDGADQAATDIASEPKLEGEKEPK